MVYLETLCSYTDSSEIDTLLRTHFGPKEKFNIDSLKKMYHAIITESYKLYSVPTKCLIFAYALTDELIQADRYYHYKDWDYSAIKKLKELEFSSDSYKYLESVDISIPEKIWQSVGDSIKRKNTMYIIIDINIPVLTRFYYKIF